MENKTRKIGTTTAVLIVTVALLASSTVFLALYVVQPNRSTSTAGVSPHSQGSLQLPEFNVATVTGQSGSSSGANAISVTGSGEASYTPNEALLQISVQTDNTTATVASASNAVEMTNVIKALNGIGISNSSIETQGYSLSANYANCYSSCVPQIIGYSVTNSLQVNITSSDPAQLGTRAGQVIDTSVKAGANGISLSFGATTSLLDQLTTEALQNAVGSADVQAKAIASSLGVSISGVISAAESSSGNYYPEVYGTFASTAAVNSVPTPISVGTQTASATVLVVYSIS